MCVFLKRLNVLLLLFFTIILAFYVIFISVIRQAVSFNCPNDAIIVLGNSLAANGINPSSSDKEIINMASEGEPFFWTFYKVKVLFDSGLRSDTFLIEISPNQFADSYNPTRQEKLIGFLPRYGSFLSSNELSGILKHSSTSEFLYAARKGPIRWLKNFIKYKDDWFPVIGGYTQKHGVFHSNDTVPANQLNLSGSSLNSTYFIKLVNYLNRHGKKVFLYHSPKPNSTDEYWDVSEQSANELINCFNLDSQFILLNYDLNRMPDSLFADKWHLNPQGSSYFTKSFFDNWLGQ